MSPETGKRPPETQNVDVQTTFILEIAVGIRNLSGETAYNLQRGKYQDLIRGSLGLLDPCWSPHLRSYSSHPPLIGSFRIPHQQQHKEHPNERNQSRDNNNRIEGMCQSGLPCIGKMPN